MRAMIHISTLIRGVYQSISVTILLLTSVEGCTYFGAPSAVDGAFSLAPLPLLHLRSLYAQAPPTTIVYIWLPWQRSAVPGSNCGDREVRHAVLN